MKKKKKKKKKNRISKKTLNNFNQPNCQNWCCLQKI